MKFVGHISTKRPTITLSRDIDCSVPWHFPKHILHAGTVCHVSPANNLPGSSPGYWLEHKSINNDYGVLVQDNEFTWN